MPNRDKTSDANLAPSGSTGTRKTYTAPVLQRFGQLNRVTQGSGGTKGDGGGTMTRGGGGGAMGASGATTGKGTGKK